MYLYRHPDSGLAGWHGFGEPQPQPQQQPQQPRAKQVYAAQPGIRELTDRHFQNIFYDRGKLIVVSFWADSCRPCDAVASTVASVAQQIAQGPHAKVVKFYHAQWDPAVNPRLHKQYGFGNIPVVYFYYMSTGKQPSKAQPLLEAAIGPAPVNAAKYLHNIDTILRRHGHVNARQTTSQTKTIAQARGWNHSQFMIVSGDFKHVDAMLVAPSPVKKYLDPLYRANPNLRLSRLAKVVDPSVFNVTYQRIHGSLPGADTAGVVDPATLDVYLRSMTQHLQVYLNSAVHEAVHLFTCRNANRRFAFYVHYGSAVTEGFTQLVTERILHAQQVKKTGSPYADELAVAEKIVSKLGFDAVAEDYFRCTRNVYNALIAKNLFSRFFALRRDAESATSDAIRKQKYRDMIRLLDGLP